MKRIAIVDYGMSNLDSVSRAVQECGGIPRITQRPQDLRDATHIILPGVGVFADGMKQLRERGYEEALQEQVLTHHIPFLGICLGMQLMATRGFEGGETAGLSWISGDVVRLKPGAGDTRIPHVGWNEVVSLSDAPLFRGLRGGQDFYFVHSWHLQCTRPEEVMARTPYCGEFVSAVGRDRIFGTQFHPEKSQKAGFQVLRNFLSI